VANCVRAFPTPVEVDQFCNGLQKSHEAAGAADIKEGGTYSELVPIN